MYPSVDLFCLVCSVAAYYDKTANCFHEFSKNRSEFRLFQLYLAVFLLSQLQGTLIKLQLTKLRKLRNAVNYLDAKPRK